MGQRLSLTEHFKLGTDGHVAVLYGAGVNTLIVVGDVGDLQPAVREQVDSGICQGQQYAAALPMKGTHTHTHTNPKMQILNHNWQVLVNSLVHSALFFI